MFLFYTNPPHIQQPQSLKHLTYFFAQTDTHFTNRHKHTYFQEIYRIRQVTPCLRIQLVITHKKLYASLDDRPISAAIHTDIDTKVHTHTHTNTLQTFKTDAQKAFLTSIFTAPFQKKSDRFHLSLILLCRLLQNCHHQHSTYKTPITHHHAHKHLELSPLINPAINI